MSYLVLARKWRPQKFNEVVGQTHVTNTLANAIEMNRVAHAFVFSGVRGVGKTSLARILAKSLNCVNGPTTNPCGECDSCRSIAASTAVDVIEIDGASNNSVDDIRELRETVPYRPAVGRFKIYVIDEVHMLSVSAFNALLKTLEEPPPHVKFIFATTEAHKIPVTILSRCQRYDFRRIPTLAIVERIRTILLEEKIRAEDQALALIGREAEGSMRDALSVLDQILAAGDKEITAKAVAELLGVVDGQVLYDISRAILKGDSPRILETIRDVDNQGYNIPTFAKGLLEHLRNLVVVGVCQGSQPVIDLPDKEVEELLEQAKSVSRDTLHRLFKHFSEAYEAIARSSHPRILLETSLVRIADLGELIPAADLVKRLEALAARSGPDGGQGGVPPGTGRGRQSPPQKETVREIPRSNMESIGTSEQKPIPMPLTQAPPNAPLRTEVNWEQEIEIIKKEKPNLASILEYGVPGTDDNGKIVIRFAKEYRAVADLATERRLDIAKSIEERLGRRVEVDICMDETVQTPVVALKRMEREDQHRRREEEARQHPLVKQIQAEFQGTVSQVRLKSGPEDLDA
ncbi:MAG: DNA polymerase III subunit gamma/tau [Proteobacteria bacterium]|nr:DNA polymerase III subunit gamma/tau [Pseudomonadota bacterium]